MKIRSLQLNFQDAPPKAFATSFSPSEKKCWPKSKGLSCNDFDPLGDKMGEGPLKTDLEAIERAFSWTSHPEGGQFIETYRSQEFYETSRGERCSSTSILFLLKEGEFSSFHRIQSDELWHYHLGGPLEIIEISPCGELKKTILGKGLAFGEHLQHCVCKGQWFASHPLSKYTLVGCTVSPGFEFEDFELGQRGELIDLYPQHKSWIEKLTSP